MRINYPILLEGPSIDARKKCSWKCCVHEVLVSIMEWKYRPGQAGCSCKEKEASFFFFLFRATKESQPGCCETAAASAAAAVSLPKERWDRKGLASSDLLLTLQGTIERGGGGGGMKVIMFECYRGTLSCRMNDARCVLQLTNACFSLWPQSQWIIARTYVCSSESNVI